ncbi:MAG TPA: SRPBCC family protein [Ornithinibacter sp.]|nr:SRPBCC family protein [Ornithinibacter sp.]
MGVIEFELERTIRAPIQEVFSRLADINGYGEWMPRKGSILRHTQQTSPGEPARGTTFLDETRYGPTPGEIVEFEAPHTVVFHWWDSSRSGKLKAEGWPGYSLQRADDDTTLVRHHAKMNTYRHYRLATPVFRRIAVKERTLTVDALKASFETAG